MCNDHDIVLGSLIKALLKYPAIFCILFFYGYGQPCHHFYEESTLLLTLRKAKCSEKEFVDADSDLLIQSAPSHKEKRNIDYAIVENVVNGEDLNVSEKHLSNWALCIYACHLSFLQERVALLVYSFNKDFSYNTSNLYLEFQVFRI